MEYGLYKLHQRMGIMRLCVSQLHIGGLLVRKAYDVLATVRVKLEVSQEHRRTRQHCFISIIDYSSSKLYIHNGLDLALTTTGGSTPVKYSVNLSFNGRQVNFKFG